MGNLKQPLKINMDKSNIIAIVIGGTGFVISIIGLIVTPILNLKSKRLEKRLEYRFQLFQKVLELWELTHKNKPLNETAEPLLLEINKLIQLYGYNKEIELFQNVIDSYNEYGKEYTDIKKQELISKFNNFFKSSFNTYRKEIVLEKLE
jgi:hypothetical protein